MSHPLPSPKADHGYMILLWVLEHPKLPLSGHPAWGAVTALRLCPLSPWAMSLGSQHHGQVTPMRFAALTPCPTYPTFIHSESRCAQLILSLLHPKAGPSKMEWQYKETSKEKEFTLRIHMYSTLVVLGISSPGRRDLVCQRGIIMPLKMWRYEVLFSSFQDKGFYSMNVYYYQ